MTLRRLALLLSSAPASASSGGDMAKSLVPGTHCLDGSEAAYYYAAPPTPSSLWVIYLKGGGACHTEEDCAKRSKGALGSSKGYAATMTGSGLYSGDATKNPDFAGAHRVFVPYCTGDTHAGTRNATSSATWGLYFSGHLNLVAIVDHLAGKGLSSATNVLLAGGSAGGIGTFVNLDWLAGRLPQAAVKGAPNAGWFFPGALPADFPDSYAPPPSYECFVAGRPSPVTCETNGSTALLWQTYFNPACSAAQAAGEEFHCGTVHVLYPFIKQPLYVIENQYDTNQIYTQMGCPRGDGPEQRTYVGMYGEAMRNSTNQVLANTAKKDGIFLPSCLAHGVSDATMIKDHTWMPVLGDWFFGRGKLTEYHQLVDDCVMTDQLPCNPARGCQVPGSTPTPPPAPGPPGGCQHQLEGDGCLAAASPMKCGVCARQHTKDLTAAGCTKQVVTQLCKSI